MQTETFKQAAHALIDTLPDATRFSAPPTPPAWTRTETNVAAIVLLRPGTTLA